MSPRTIAIWSLVGIASATLITGGVFGLTSLEEKRRYEDSAYQAFKDRTTSRALASDILLGIAGASAVTALILVLTRKSDDETTGAQSPKARLQLTPSGASFFVTY